MILVMGYHPGTSRDIPLWYNSVKLGIPVYVGISRDTSALPVISGIAIDIPVSAFCESVISGYPHVCMLKIVYSGLLNAQIARTAIWTSSWKRYFSSAPGAAWRPRRAQDHRRQLLHPHRREVWEARRRGGHHSPLLLAQDSLVPADSEGPAAPVQRF